MNGHADRIEVTLHKDGASCTVADNGRGIPVDSHAKYKKPALELILTTLHAGGKFEAKNYYHSGGLHGVGASVVNALSEKLVGAREARRRGVGAVVRARQGRPASSRSSAPARGSGTTITSAPTRRSSRASRFDAELIAERLEAKAYLHGGLTVEFHDEAAGTKATFHYEDGIARLPREARRASDGKRRSRGEVVHHRASEQDGLHLECALAWTEDTQRARARRS